MADATEGILRALGVMRVIRTVGDPRFGYPNNPGIVFDDGGVLMGVQDKAGLLQGFGVAAGSTPIANNLSTNSTAAALSAAQGVVIAQLVAAKATLQQGALVADSTVAPNSQSVADFVLAAVASLVGQAPTTLNQLAELAAALGNDPNFATTIMAALGTKLPAPAGGAVGDVLTKQANGTYAPAAPPAGGGSSAAAPTATPFAANALLDLPNGRDYGVTFLNAAHAVVLGRAANPVLNASALYTIVASGDPGDTLGLAPNTFANEADFVFDNTQGRAHEIGEVQRALGTYIYVTLGGIVPNAGPIVAAPAITTQPAAQSVQAPAAATFSVVAAGSGLTYQWRRTPSGGSAADIAGATSASYTTPATTTGDTGSAFSVVATNTGGSVTSNAVSLTVAAPALTAPAITSQPAAQSVVAPATATFTVAASGNPTPTYQWQKTPSGGSAANIAGATSASYTTPATTTGDTGASFRCVVTNTQGSVTSNAVGLTVNATAPSLTTLFEDSFLVSNSTQTTGAQSACVNLHAPDVSNAEGAVWSDPSTYQYIAGGARINHWFDGRTHYPVASARPKMIDLTFNLNGFGFFPTFRDAGDRSTNTFYMFEVSDTRVQLDKWDPAISGGGNTVLWNIPTTAWASNASSTLSILDDSSGCTVLVNGTALTAPITLDGFASAKGISLGTPSDFVLVTHVKVSA